MREPVGNAARTPEALAELETQLVMVFYEGWVSGDPQVRAFLAQDPARITQLWRDYLADLTESESIARLAIATSEVVGQRYTLSLLAMPERARGAEALMNYTLASIVLSWKLGISHDTALDTMLRTAHLGSQVVVDGGSLASTAELRELLTPLGALSEIHER